MALYYDAASILCSEDQRGSLKSRIYGTTDLKSSPAQLFALISEVAKRDQLLKEVIENAQLINDEPKITPLLALLLCHDHFFAKSGISAAQKHPLRQAVERHKARLQSEFTRARLRRSCASVESLKVLLDEQRRGGSKQHPRWARVNTITVSDAAVCLRSIPNSIEKSALEKVLQVKDRSLAYCFDWHIPDLLAFPSEADLSKTEAYNTGHLILQDKASCFPAHLLLGDQSQDEVRDVIDGCAAPGNKTTHLAAIMHKSQLSGKIFACERDSMRSKTLATMVGKAGAGHQVTILAKQDFLALDPQDVKFHSVSHLLLDPSCSGSGILDREDIPKLALPNAPQAKTAPSASSKIDQLNNSKKRKRDATPAEPAPPVSESHVAPDEEETAIPVNAERLQKLSNLQTRIVEHAMRFPAAKRITYSTCSVHEQENEVVVTRLLKSDVARERGWNVLARAQQVDGLKKWKHRGRKNGESTENELTAEELEACIRCHPGDEEGTMGFFVCAFVRMASHEGTAYSTSQAEALKSSERKVKNGVDDVTDGNEENDDWEGFD